MKIDILIFQLNILIDIYIFEFDKQLDIKTTCRWTFMIYIFKKCPFDANHTRLRFGF